MKHALKMLFSAVFVFFLAVPMAYAVIAHDEAVTVAPNLEWVDPYTLKGDKDLLRDYLPENSDGSINVVVEIPAGTNAKWEVDKMTGELKWEFKEGVPRVVKYLGYPGNYGFVPRSLLPHELGGDGDPLDVIVLGPAVPRGSVIPVKIIGVLRLLDKGEQDDKLIAIQSGTPLAKVDSLEELDKKFPGATDIVSTWFANYKGQKKIEILGYANKHEADKIVKTSIQAYKE
ncbi:MAG: inorganic diphosphatase [Pseudomonadales bacterium]|nr:inorganic diphosphatase [Pseudomonadales bacterium]